MHLPRFTELLTKELTGQITPEEQQELNALLAQKESLRREYELVREYWGRKEQSYADIRAAFQKLSETIRTQEAESGIPGAFSATPLRRRPVFRTWWTAAAAVLLLGIAGYGSYRLFFRHPSAIGQSVNWQVKYTPKGTRSDITLPDGTNIKLNADSRLQFPAAFTGKTRDVYLTGEAFFKVARNPDHPFIIHANKVNIKVLGTEFNVRSYPDDSSMETTLLQGSIEVTFADRPSDRIILKPKDKLVIRNPLFKTAMAPPGNTDTKPGRGKNGTAPVEYSLTALTYYRGKDSIILETSWVHHKLAFQNEDFASLAKRMERWYNVSIQFRNQNLSSYRFTGEFEHETIREALFALHLSDDFQYRIDGTHVYIF